MSVGPRSARRGSPRGPSEGRVLCRSVLGPPGGGPPEAPLEPLNVGYAYVGRSAAPRGPS